MKSDVTKITYRIVDGFGELRKLIRGKGHKLLIYIEPASDGYIAIGDAVIKVNGGKAEINLSLLDEGILSPSFAGDERVTLEPVLYDKGKIYSMPISEEALRRLLVRFDLLTTRHEALCQRVCLIEKKLGGPLIF